MAISVPAVFWLFAQALFNDWDRRSITLNSQHVGTVLVFVGISFASYWSQRTLTTNEAYSTASWSLFYLSYFLRIGFLVLAFTAILRQGRQDLVEARRRLRMIIATLTGGYMLAVVCAELLLRGESAPLLLELGNSLFIVMLLLAASVWLISAGPDSFSATLGLAAATADSGAAPVESLQDPPAEPNRRLGATERDWLQELQHYMESEQGYHRCDLTIGSLGEQLSIPEHLLRRLINQHLGYRNFNEYLNHYRIAEAAARLEDIAQERLPILTIALEVGYASLTPFNRAFKAHFQQTPSEYRRLAASRPK